MVRKRRVLLYVCMNLHWVALSVSPHFIELTDSTGFIPTCHLYTMFLHCLVMAWAGCIHCQELDLSPSSPTSPGPKSQAEAELLERKTTVMRLQNRLQKIFAKQLTPGKSVWCWRYEKNEVDHTFQASVHISLLDRSFTGGWAATHQAAQMEACNQLAAFLDRDFKA